MRASGEVSERLKEHAWKVCVRQKRTEGSNPSLSANLRTKSTQAQKSASAPNPAVQDAQVPRSAGRARAADVRDAQVPRGAGRARAAFLSANSYYPPLTRRNAT